MTGNGRGGCTRHGLTVLKARVKVRGLSALDQRTAAARALLHWQRELVRDLGGEDAASSAQRALVEIATRTRLYVESLDAFLMEQPSLIVGRGKKKTVLPVLIERQRLADSLAHTLGRLGLERRAKTLPSLDQYVKDTYGAKEPL